MTNQRVKCTQGRTRLCPPGHMIGNTETEDL